jgi:hypothetical protein
MNQRAEYISAADYNTWMETIFKAPIPTGQSPDYWRKLLAQRVLESYQYQFRFPLAKPTLAAQDTATLEFSVVSKDDAATKAVTYRNKLSYPVTLNTPAVVLGSANSAEFSVTNPAASISAAGSCVNGGTVAPGASCTVNIRYAPTTLGAKTGTVTLTPQQEFAPRLTITLKGQGGTGIDTDNDGVSDDVETLLNTHPKYPTVTHISVRDNDVMSDNVAFIRQQTRDFYNREIDDAALAIALATFSNTADPLNDRVNLVMNHFVSAEYQNSGALVIQMYLLYLGRAPTLAEYRTQVAKLRVQGPLPLADRLAADAAFTFKGFNDDRFPIEINARIAGVAVITVSGDNTSAPNYALAKRLADDLVARKITRAEVMVQLAPQISTAGKASAFTINETALFSLFYSVYQRNVGAVEYNAVLNFLLSPLANSDVPDLRRRTLLRAMLTSGDYSMRFK